MSDDVNVIREWLGRFVRQHGAVAGSVHRRSGPDELALVSAHNLPPPVISAVMKVPRGKGMAGLAFERDQPVSTCNLKTDQTGDVRPGAKAVDAKAAVALPVHDRGGELRAVVGIAFADERELGDAELAALARAASDLPPV